MLQETSAVQKKDKEVPSAFKVSVCVEQWGKGFLINVPGIHSPSLSNISIITTCL